MIISIIIIIINNNCSKNNCMQAHTDLKNSRRKKILAMMTNRSPLNISSLFIHAAMQDGSH